MESNTKTMTINRIGDTWIATVDDDTQAFESFAQAAEWATTKLYGGGSDG